MANDRRKNRDRVSRLKGVILHVAQSYVNLFQTCSSSFVSVEEVKLG